MTDRGRRTIDLDTETVAVLKRWRRVQLEGRVGFEGGWQDTGFIFTRKDGRLQDPDVGPKPASLSIRYLMRPRGVPKKRAH